MAKKPRRAYSLDVKMEADTPEELFYAIKTLLFDLQHNGMNDVSSGGTRSSYVAIVQTNLNMTHEKYMTQLDEYIKASRESL